MCCSSFLPHRGVTLLEVLISLGIFSLLVVGGSAMFISAFRTNRVVWDQLSGQTDARRVLARVTDDVRRAETSSTGSYAIQSVTSSQIVFFANVNNDSFRERVRFWLDDTTLYEGITAPTGTPLGYPTSTEAVTVLATNVVNTAHGIPVFSYYDESYNGTQGPIPSPVPVTDVRIVRVQLEIDINPILSPVPLHVEGMVHMRTIKTN